MLPSTPRPFTTRPTPSTRSSSPVADTPGHTTASCDAHPVRSEPHAHARVHEEPRRLIVQPPAKSEANFQIRRRQPVHAGAEEMKCRVLGFAGCEDTEVLGVCRPPLADRHAKHCRRCPLME